MLISYKRGQGSIVLRVKILNNSVATGAGLTGLTSASSGLIISTIADNEATATTYTVAGSTIESITTLGTYATPTATKCRFKEVDSTNHKGVYEIQIADARYAVSSAKSLMISISGATNCCETDVVIPLRDLDPYDSVRAGLTALPAAAAAANGGLPTVDANNAVKVQSGTGANQLSITSGVVDANVTKNAGTAITSASGRQEVNVTHWSGTILGAADTAGYPKVTIKNGTGTGEVSLSSGKVLLSATQVFDNTGTWTGNLSGSVGSVATGGIGSTSFASGAINAAAIGTGAFTSAKFAAGAFAAGIFATDSIDAAALKADAVAEIQSGLATSASQTTIIGYIDTEVAAIKAKTDNLPASPAATSDVPTVAAIADGVWDEVQSGHTTNGTFGKYVDSRISDVYSTLGTILTDVETVMTGVNVTQYNGAPVGAYSDDLENASSNASGVSTLVTRLGVPVGASVVADISAVNDNVQSVLDDTGTLLARLGAFTGTGVNTVLGFLKAMFTSSAATPSDMGGTATAANHSNQAIRVRGDAAWTTGGGGGGGGTAGSGADQCTMNIKVSGQNVPDADVWVTSDADGATTVAGTRQTNSNGNVTFMLDAGATYYLWAQKDGFNLPQGEVFTAQADA